MNHDTFLANIRNSVNGGKSLLVGGVKVAEKKDDSYFFFNAVASKKGPKGTPTGTIDKLLNRLDLDKDARGNAILAALTNGKFKVGEKTYARRADGAWDLPAASENPSAKRVIAGLTESQFLLRVSNYLVTYVRENRSFEKFTITERTK